MDKGGADIAVEFQLIPAVPAQMRLPPGIDGIQRKPRQTGGVGNTRRVTVALGDANLVNERGAHSGRLGRLQLLHDARHPRQGDVLGHFEA